MRHGQRPWQKSCFVPAYFSMRGTEVGDKAQNASVGQDFAIPSPATILHFSALVFLGTPQINEIIKIETIQP